MLYTHSKKRSENGDNYKGFLVLGCNGGNLIIMSISNTSSPSCEVVSVNQVCIDIIYLLYIQLLFFNKSSRKIIILNTHKLYLTHIHLKHYP